MGFAASCEHVKSQSASPLDGPSSPSASSATDEYHELDSSADCPRSVAYGVRLRLGVLALPQMSSDGFGASVTLVRSQASYAAPMAANTPGVVVFESDNPCLLVGFPRASATAATALVFPILIALFIGKEDLTLVPLEV